MAWSGEARVVMWFLSKRPIIGLCRHNFYRPDAKVTAVERHQKYEYTLGHVAWLEYRSDD